MRRKALAFGFDEAEATMLTPTSGRLLASAPGVLGPRGGALGANKHGEFVGSGRRLTWTNEREGL